MRRLWVLATILLLGGCEEMVDPIIETDRPFTLFGFLDPGSDTQAIRVFPIDEVLVQAGTDPLDATVLLSRPGGGTVEFADSIVFYFDGSVGHVFHAGYRPDFGANYTLVARTSDGRETTASVRTPTRASLTLGQADGVLGNVRMPVVFGNAEQVLSPRVLYTFESTRAPFRWTIPVVYGPNVARDGMDWSIVVDLSRDIGVLYTVTGLQPGLDPITLNQMEIQAFVATGEWTPPEGDFDPELLVQPGVFSNVENGFGFVGAGYTESTTTLPAAEILRLAGFANN